MAMDGEWRICLSKEALMMENNAHETKTLKNENFVIANGNIRKQMSFKRIHGGMYIFSEIPRKSFPYHTIRPEQ